MSKNLKTEFKCSYNSFQWGVNIAKCFNGTEFIKFPYSASSYVKISVKLPKKDVNICIQVDGNFCSSKFIICNILLLDVLGIKQKSRQATHLFQKGELKSWEFPSFFKIKPLDSAYVKDGCFTLQCDITVLDGSIVEVIRERRYLPFAASNFPYDVDTFTVLQDDIKRMYTDKIHTDIKLKTETEVFPAHKNILCARSPVFLAMFDNDMAESQKGEVDIPDLDAKTAELFLEYIYTGTVKDLDYKNAMNLILVADKYQVLSLKTKCAELLESMVTDANVCEILVTADLVQQADLKAFVFDYIKKQPDKIFNSEQWKLCVKNNLELASETLSEVSRLWGNQTKCQTGETITVKQTTNGFGFFGVPDSNTKFTFAESKPAAPGFTFGSSSQEKFNTKDC